MKSNYSLEWTKEFMLHIFAQSDSRGRFQGGKSAKYVNSGIRILDTLINPLYEEAKVTSMRG